MAKCRMPIASRQIMKQFTTFVKKEFRHIFRDKRTMLILLGMPVIQIILFGFAITTEVKNTKIVVFDPSKDVATRQIIDKLNTSKYFDVAEYLTDASKIDRVFKDGKVSMAIVFGESFNENLLHTGKAQIQLIADATDPNTAVTITNYANAIIGSYQLELLKLSGIPYQIKPEIKFLYNPQMKSSYNFVPGVLGMIMMLICAMMTAIAIVREKEMGTMEVLLVSPMKPIFIILAKAVPYFTLSCINLVTVLLLSVYVLDVPVAGSIVLLFLVSMLFIFVALALGLLVSTRTSKQMAAMLISGMAFMMPVVLLSGMMFPIENMPVVLQWLSNIIPAKWYIICVKDIMIKGVGIEFILKEVLILALMAFVIVMLSLKNFKNRLE